MRYVYMCFAQSEFLHETVTPRASGATHEFLPSLPPLPLATPISFRPNAIFRRIRRIRLSLLLYCILKKTPHAVNLFFF